MGRNRTVQRVARDMESNMIVQEVARDMERNRSVLGAPDRTLAGRRNVPARLRRDDADAARRDGVVPFFVSGWQVIEAAVAEVEVRGGQIVPNAKDWVHAAFVAAVARVGLVAGHRCGRHAGWQRPCAHVAVLQLLQLQLRLLLLPPLPNLVVCTTAAPSRTRSTTDSIGWRYSYYQLFGRCSHGVMKLQTCCCRAKFKFTIYRNAYYPDTF